MFWSGQPEDDAAQMLERLALEEKVMEAKRIDDGGAAFPRPASEFTPDGNNAEPSQSGMSLRDYFAAQALVGILTNNHTCALPLEEKVHGAFNVADAMIAARKSKKAE